MKFGIFLPNGSNGYLLSTAAPQYSPTFAHNLAITRAAEDAGMDFVLSMMKFRGFGGDTGYWDSCLDSFSLMAGLAAATSKIELYPSITVLSTHPALAARMVATIDDISGGRCGLNIVTGWNKPEYTQMGLWPGDEYYEQRYEFAAEYLQILKKAWADGSVTHHGQFFELEDCSVLPRPSRDVPIVCAGQSQKGLSFTAECGDHNFVMATPHRLREIAANLEQRAGAFGRHAGTFALFTVIAEDTDEEAIDIATDLVASADEAAIANVITSASLDVNPAGTSEALRTGLAKPLQEGNSAFMGFPVIAGSYKTVAQQIGEIGAIPGVDGVMLNFRNFVPDIRAFGEKVMPVVQRATVSA
ncbi:pyrimidine oxygenase [Pseudonocardia ammonioxydans]|uniref:Pyrimidine oxygenase n=1 Tax=Pseudonocardia ammonioxydans TaxID=260086 RepID=A0A1I5HMM9_PSUAM|nr:LLM class flavin-dependent oxidoreductase [Pseudonocardia ammonioxydans]SFO49270.1 pyrimidine oxygenase [Pseudonocardia ammonioxydans]